ncbi:NAD(P)/FAD-dependent oxidoreductase [Streptomyces sp. NPDC057474]|uniref:NAD(P)/FAD-dependent oxidoreductase n=1 Tax=Streptomyces sp. NPDC057474 TaxID=3346144 RepID=UPI0036C04A04
MTTTVIVGAGQAGVQVAASLRQEGYRGRVVLVGDEAEQPYERPPLSKAILLGAATEEQIRLRADGFYAANGIELLTGERVTHVDRVQRRLRLAGGGELGWDHLVLATGARPRVLGLPGTGLAGVLPLHSLGDARVLREQLSDARRIVIVGGGFIGLEFASACADKDVVLLEAADRLMGRAVTQPVSAFFAGAHAARGVRIELSIGATEFVGSSGRVTAVRTTRGALHPADLVLVGAGSLPETQLAERAGLAVRDGVLVDSTLRTSDPQVFAVGDCARFPGAHHTAGGTTIRLESVQNAMDQARHVARQIAAGEVSEFRALPWFWSDQKGLGLRIAGLGQGHTQTHVLGDPDAGAFSVLVFREERLVTVESVNRPGDHAAARRILSSGAIVTLRDVAASGFTLKAAARGGTVSTA